ncbi:MAG: hypothetical protein M1829_006709 [Trizodia sp. TS-e1964]|nr:MAG: hypothetical protein M1829_006709 [Trizodia sp. TS-e1964]
MASRNLAEFLVEGPAFGDFFDNFAMRMLTKTLFRALTRRISTKKTYVPTNASPSDDLKVIEEARHWIAQLPDIIPSRICEVSYSRSSGPGGQKVNKTNSKATLRVSLDTLLPLIPQVLHEPITDSPYYASTSQAIVISADRSRNQKDNRDDCLDKFCSIFRSAHLKSRLPADEELAKATHR